MDEYEKKIAENEEVKADPTDGKNTYREMDLDMELPEGLAFSMAMNHKAMDHFCNMSPEERERVIEESRKVAAKEQMTQLVDRIATNSFQ